MWCSPKLVSWLYGVSLLTTQLTANPVGSSPLSFQVEPTSDVIPSSQENNWSIEQPEPEDIQAEQNNRVFASRVKPNTLYNSNLFLPFPSPFLGLFQGLVNSLSSLAFPTNNRPHHHHHHPEGPIDCTKYTIGEVELDSSSHSQAIFRRERASFASPSTRMARQYLTSCARGTLQPGRGLYPICSGRRRAHSSPQEETPSSPGRRQAINNPFEALAVDQDSHADSSTHLFWDAVEAIESMNDCPHMNIWSEGEDDEKERKKKFFLHAIQAVLKYHLSPGSKKIHEILDSSTLPTELPIQHEPKAAKFRVRVGPALPHLNKPGEIILNFFTKLDTHKYRPILTKNGVIYIIEKLPLLPPLSPLSELFLFPHPYSTLTTALQKTHLDDVLLPRWENKTIPLSSTIGSSQSLVPSSALDDTLDMVDERVQSILSSLTGDHGGKLVKSSFTVFAPTNHAFRSVGPEANAFLFSPFGQHILRYVLSYHIVPDVIWNTDHCERTHAGIPSVSCDCDLDSKTYEIDQSSAPHGHHPFPPLPGKVNVTEFSLGTLLGSRKNESLPITLVKFRHLGKGPITRRVYIRLNREEHNFGPPDKHAIPVVIADGVAWGGALHMIPKLIHPPVPEGHRHQHRKDVQRAIKLSILSPPPSAS
ncbi:hypothetical protein PSHT_09914 [Puccinia striiformis]|uniref:FAS1 domain-containing protein n=1 Tax=Puccinia striiformis TaxID=27350 RepID=A0A2S4VDD6_9BASI|nr:hypothetical protein PSHT_09914 [Puccinia striiformis]